MPPFFCCCAVNGMYAASPSHVHKFSRTEKGPLPQLAEVLLLNYSDFVEQFDLVFALLALM